jgi:hypothetical protein
VGEVVEAFVRGSPNELAEHREHMVALVFRHGRGALTHIAPLNGRFQRERLQPIERPDGNARLPSNRSEREKTRIERLD